MKPTTAFLNGIAAAVAADVLFLAEVAKVEIVLARNAFPEGIGTVIADLTLADFDGYAAKAVGVATVSVYTDPLTGDIVLLSAEPAGGWHWVTTGVTNLPQTIYGYGLTDSTGAVLIACKRFADPVTLNAIGQGISIPQVDQRFNGSSWY